VGFGTYRHNDEKCTATVHSYWLYNTIIPIYHKPTITVMSLLYAYSNIPNNPWTQGRRQGFQSGGWLTGKATPSEARRAESGGGVLGRGQPAPSPPARGSGERCELPQRGSGRSPGRSAVFLYFECSGWFLL